MTGKRSIENTPLPLFDVTQPWQTEIYRKRLETNVMIGAHPGMFRKDFEDWLRTNNRVWRAFADQADRIWDRGTRRYSARTIGEWLRHETAMREAPNEHGWKLNDHFWPDLARLYMLMHLDRDGFFERRVNPLAVRAA